jgi:hypothetical protein
VTSFGFNIDYGVHQENLMRSRKRDIKSKQRSQEWEAEQQHRERGRERGTAHHKKTARQCAVPWSVLAAPSRNTVVCPPARRRRYACSGGESSKAIEIVAAHGVQTAGEAAKSPLQLIALPQAAAPPASVVKSAGRSKDSETIGSQENSEEVARANGVSQTHPQPVTFPHVLGL